MDYQSLTRKQLQALCKKHGIPANLSNSEMANRLSTDLKGSQKLTSQGVSLGGNSRKKRKGNDSVSKTTKVVKKVRFSPENETFVYYVSGYKRGGRRRCTVKSVPEMQIQATENVVSSPPLGRKRAKRDVQNQDAAKDEGSRMLSGKRITRSQTKSAGEACGSRISDLEGAIQDTSKVFEIVKNVAVLSGHSRRTRRNTVMLTSTVSADVESETQQSIGQKGACLTKNVPRRSRRNVVDGAANSSDLDKVLQQTKPKVTKDHHSEISSGNPRRLRSINEIIKPHTKTGGKASAAESGNEEENVQLEEHSMGLVRHNSRRKSVVSQKGKVRSDGLQEREENRNRPRNNDLKGVSELEAFVEPSKEVQMVQNVFGSIGPSRRTRRNTVMLKSSNSANELSENYQTSRQKDISLTKNLRKSSRIASRTISTVTSSKVDGKANDVGKDGQQKRRQEPILDEDASLSKYKPLTKRLLKQSTRNASKMDFVEPAEPTGKAVGKKQHGSSKMPITEQKAIYSEKLSAPEDGRLVVEEAANYKDKVDASYSKQLFESSKKRKANGGKIRANRQHGSFEASTVNSATGDGAADDVGKVRQQKRRKKPILDEDASLNECEPLTKSPLKRSTRIATKMGFVEPAKPTGKAVGKKQNGRSKMSFKKQKALYSEKLSASEHGRLAVAANYKNKVDGSYSKQVFESSKKKREENGGEVGANKQHGSFEASTVNSAEEEAADTMVNLEETSVSTLVKLPFGSSPSNQSDDSAEPLNFVDLEKVNGAEEPSLGNNMNHWCENVDDQSNKDDRVSVQEYQNLELSQAKTGDNVTTDRIDTQEASYSERASQVVSEKITNGVYEGNLLVGSSAIPISVGIDGKDAKRKEVSEMYIQDSGEKENKLSEQSPHNVSKETGGKCMHELPDAAVSNSELVLEKIYDGTELVRERNCSVDITAEDVSPNEDYAASKGIDGKSLSGEADVEQCADVAKEEHLECALKVELQDKSDQEVVAPHVNVTAGTSLTDIISKESEVSGEKAVETTMNPVTFIKGVDNIKVEESKFEDRNSDTEVIDVGALTQVSGTCLVQDETLEECNVSIPNERTGDRVAQMLAMKRMDFLDKAGNVDALVAVSPVMPRKTCADESAEINDRATSVFNKVIAADVEDHGERSNEFMGFVPHVEEVNFGDLDSYLKENVSELERSASVTSDNLLTTNSRAADVEKSAGGTSEANLITQDCKEALQVKENLSTAELFDQQIAVNHLDEQEHHTHQAVSDEPICDNEKSHQKNEFSAFDEEHIDCEIQKDKSYVSAELLLIDAAASSGSHIAELNGFETEYVSDDLKDVENIAVGSGSSRSGSRGNSTDRVHTEATKSTNTTEIENAETIEPVTPCTGCESPTETSNEFTGTLLQQIFSSRFGWKVKNCKEINEGNLHNEDYSSDAGRKEMADEDIGNFCSNMTLLFLEETEASIVKSKPVDGINPDHNARDSQEVVKDQMDEHEGAANEATFRDGICRLGLNQPLWVKKSKGPGVETEEADGSDGLHHLDDNVVTADDFKNVTDSETSNVVSTSIAETAGDCSATSPVTFSSNPQNKAIELDAESLMFTSWEMSSFKGPSKNCEVEYSAGAVETTFKRYDVRDVKDDIMIMEQVAAQVDEEQVSEHKTAEEASEPENMLVTVHGTSGEPICDSKELDPAKELSAFNLEHIDCEMQKGTSYVSAEVLLIEASAASGSPFADLDGFNKEYVSDDPKDAGNIAVDAGVLSCSGLSRISMDKVQIGANKTVNTQEVENVGTGQSLTPKKMCAGFENPKETSNDNSGTALQQLFSSGSRWKESFCKEMNNGDEHNKDYSNDAGRTEMADQDVGGFSPEHNARDFWEAVQDQLDEHWVNDNVLIMEQVAAQVTEEQFPENIRAEDVSELDPNLCSDAHEPTCKGGEGATDQENARSIIHGTFENTNPTACTDTAAEDRWKLEMNLLSPQQKSLKATTDRGNNLFAKKLNSSLRKQNKKSTSIQRTPKPLVHDMKENLLSTKREKISNIIDEKTLPKRRALEDIGKS